MQGRLVVSLVEMYRIWIEKREQDGLWAWIRGLVVGGHCKDISVS